MFAVTGEYAAPVRAEPSQRQAGVAERPRFRRRVAELVQFYAGDWIPKPGRVVRPAGEYSAAVCAEGRRVDRVLVTFCHGVRALGKWYVLDSSADARVWTAQPEAVPPGRKPARGRATTTPKVVTKPARVDEVAALPVAEGSQGPLIYEYAEVRVWFSEEGVPSGAERQLVRRSLGQEPEVKYHRTNAPAEVPLAAVAGIRSKRWRVERCFEDEKGELGLDHYEGRKYQGLKRHMILTSVSHLFLAQVHQELRGKKPGADGVPGANRDVGSGEGPVAVGPMCYAVA